MTTEPRQVYRGVLCIHCRQPIPLTDRAASVDRHFTRHVNSTDDNVVQTFTLRCRVCHLEGLYMALDVVDCDGAPKVRVLLDKSGLKNILHIVQKPCAAGTQANEGFQTGSYRYSAEAIRR